MVTRTPSSWSSVFGLALILSMVSSRSSVPSRAKYEDWIGIRTWVAATSALTVVRPRVGGVSMMIYS